MDYWDSYAWLYVLAAWFLLLSFSRDGLAAVAAMFFLAAYNLVPMILDTIPALADGPLWGLTINGLLAAGFAAYFSKKKRLGILCAYSIICVTHFSLVLVRCFGGASALNAAFFPIAYAMELGLVLCSLGLRVELGRVFRRGGRVGGGVHGHRERAV